MGDVAGAGDGAGPRDGELSGRDKAHSTSASGGARHVYWFPLVLFGVLICGPLPIDLLATRSYNEVSPFGDRVFQDPVLAGLGITSERETSYYWLCAMVLGISATVFWYRRRGSRLSLRTPARGCLITGLIIVTLALLIPLAVELSNGFWLILLPGDLLLRGTIPLVLVGVGLCLLAWAERSRGLTVIATAYLAVALLASAYDINHIFYKLGLNLTAAENTLPNVLVPALVLLLSGAGSWTVQRRQRALGQPPEPG